MHTFGGGRLGSGRSLGGGEPGGMAALVGRGSGTSREQWVLGWVVELVMADLAREGEE